MGDWKREVLRVSGDGRYFLEGELGFGSKDITTQEYFSFCDRVIQMAAEHGMYLAILPSWGSFLKSHILTMENIDEFAHFIGNRFKDHPNLIWVLGGDVKGDVAPEVVSREGEILKSYNPQRLISYHPLGRIASSMWFHEEAWLNLLDESAGWYL